MRAVVGARAWEAGASAAVALPLVVGSKVMRNHNSVNRLPDARMTASTPAGMVKLLGGTFIMGNSPDQPVGRDDLVGQIVEVRSFFMDATAVTNEAFRKFRKETSFKTEVHNSCFASLPLPLLHTMLFQRLHASTATYRSTSSACAHCADHTCQT